GSITKNGNSYARKLLVEAAWSYQHPARVSPEIQRRHEGIPKPIVDRAWDAQVRLCPALSETRRARQAEEHRGGRARQRTERVHPGHQPARDVACCPAQGADSVTRDSNNP
ncbi:hypothetical protein DFQ30_002368, partial [Apophysomyces sp. BC1015]